MQVLYSIEKQHTIEFKMHSRYGETNLHIGQECVKSYGISFILPLNSIFTNKFGEVIIIKISMISTLVST